MPCTRRPDVAPHTRIEIVSLAWLSPGIYGNMTHLAQVAQRSRTLLSPLLLAATLQVETLLSEATFRLPNDPQHFDPRLWWCRLDGNSSLLSLAALVPVRPCPPHA